MIDSDKILLLERGELKEFDTPNNLLMNQQGDFFSLVSASGGTGLGRSASRGNGLSKEAMMDIEIS